MATTFTLISSNTLSASAASITFSSIPSTYTDLCLKFSARSTGGDFYSRLEFNSDTANNYSAIILRGTGSAAASLTNASRANTTIYSGVNNSSYTAGTFANGEIYIPNYNSSSSKQIGSFAVMENNGATSYMATNAGLYRGTSAITSLQLLIDSGFSFDVDSSFYLYGISKS